MDRSIAGRAKREIDRQRLRLLEQYYPDYRSEDDAFDQMVQPFLASEVTVLDAGCGDGTITRYKYRKQVRLIVGVDIEGDLIDNTNVDVAAFADLEHLPFSTGAFDLVLCRYVIEHLRYPVRVFSEFHRILTDGGAVIIHAPNQYHYVQLAARLIPDRLHRAIIRYLFNRESFPKYHRANSRHQLIRLMRAAGFEPFRVVMFESAPDYLAFAAPIYAVGVAYERLVNRFDALADFRLNIIASFKKIKRAGTKVERQIER